MAKTKLCQVVAVPVKFCDSVSVMATPPPLQTRVARIGLGGGGGVFENGLVFEMYKSIV